MELTIFQAIIIPILVWFICEMAYSHIKNYLFKDEEDSE